MKWNRERFTVILLILADLICLNLALGLAIALRPYIPFPPYSFHQSSWQAILPFWGVLHLTMFPALIAAGGYHTLRRWSFYEALVVVIKAIILALPASTLILFALRFGVARGELVMLPSRLVVLLVWVGLLIGLIAVRFLTARVQLALYQRGVGARHSIIFGAGAAVTELTERLERNPWLGERLIGYINEQVSPDTLGEAENLPEIVSQHKIKVIWLAPPADVDRHWLPSLLFEAGGEKIVWRILPIHFEGLTQVVFPSLSYEQRSLLYECLDHTLALPIVRVAMLGSRGVPANYSGIEKYVEEVGGYLVQQGAEVTVYCHKKYVSARGYYRGMHLHLTPTIPTKHLETITHTFLATLHALTQGDDIFHYHALGPTTLAWLPRLFGRKVVTTVQGLDWERSKWSFIARSYLKFSEWTTRYLPNMTIVVSQTLLRHYNHRSKRVIFIPNGFNAPRHKHPHLIGRMGLTGNDYILFVGRLSPEKGCHTLIEAFVGLQTEKQLVLAGRATYEDGYYHQLQAAANNLNRVHFTGFVTGALLQELYSNAYLVVLPSEIEGLSISLLEALSYGNCALVSDIPENLEALQGMGHSFRAGDSADLAKKLAWLVNDPEQVKLTRQKAQTYSSQLWRWETVGQATYKIYQNLLK